MKFSVITPAWNVGTWLPETIESVLSQEGNFDIEYIIVTDPSEDTTVEIAKTYAEKVRSGAYPKHCGHLEMHVLERQGGAGSGMYAALNDGFGKATGEVHGWIAGDDLYRPHAFENMRCMFETFPDFEWIKGVSGVVNEAGKELDPGTCKLYYRNWLRLGVYGMEAYYVEQDSVFWRSSLWKKGGPFPPYFKSMGDYWLWPILAKYARLWSVNVPVSYFRKRASQDSRINAKRCKEQMWETRGNKRPLLAWIPRFFFYPYYHIVPSAFRPYMEKLYPLLFPYHSREYFEIESGKPVKRIMRSFILRN